jgi:hypothetical protein
VATVRLSFAEWPKIDQALSHSQRLSRKPLQGVQAQQAAPAISLLTYAASHIFLLLLLLLQAHRLQGCNGMQREVAEWP